MLTLKKVILPFIDEMRQWEELNQFAFVNYLEDKTIAEINVDEENIIIIRDKLSNSDNIVSYDIV